MKKYIILICVLLMMSLTACNNQNTHAVTSADTAAFSEELVETAQNTSPPEEENPIDTVEKLTEVDGVISVTKQEFSTSVKGALAYKILYETQNGKLSADIVLPEDYTDESKNYTVLIYFPQVATYIESLAADYAKNDIIVVRPYVRGFGESEGMRDLGGENDLMDSQKILEILCSAGFTENSKIFVAGSSEGSINALRLLSEDKDKRLSGCAVVDVIADLHAYGEYRGEGVKGLLKALIGKTYEESPEEYDLRSAMKFADKLDRPILLLHFLQSPMFSVEHTDAFYELLNGAGNDCTYHKIDTLSADFNGESLQRLLSWINTYD